MSDGIGRTAMVAAWTAAIMVAGAWATGAQARSEQVDRMLERLDLERHGLALSYEDSRESEGAVVLTGVSLTPTRTLATFEGVEIAEVTIGGLEEDSGGTILFEDLALRDVTLDLGDRSEGTLSEARFEGLDPAMLAWLIGGMEGAFPADAQLGGFTVQGLEARHGTPDGNAEVSLAHLSGSGIARGRIGALRLEDLSFDASGRLAEEVQRLELAGLEVADMDIAAALADPSVRTLFGRRDGETLGRGIVRRLSVESVDGTMLAEAAGWDDRLDGEGVSRTQVFVEGLRVPAEEFKDMPFGARLREAVDGTVVLSGEAALVLDPARQGVRIDPLTFSLADFGAFDGTVALLDVPNVKLDENFMGPLVNARLAGAALGYREDGLVRSVMEQVAAEENISVEEVRARARQRVIDQDMIDAETRDALLRFLDDPHRLTLRLAPDDPPSFAELLGTAMIAPKELKALMNMEFHAEQKP